MVGRLPGTVSGGERRVEERVEGNTRERRKGKRI
jgi:hypothetical protein